MDVYYAEVKFSSPQYSVGSTKHVQNLTGRLSLLKYDFKTIKWFMTFFQFLVTLSHIHTEISIRF